MAERRAVNKYYPPDWDPSKGSVNRVNKSHPLRARARKIDEGILTVRFEMPFNVWCLSCKNHIAMGVRYNAEKSKTGSYYTTPIYKFKMKCHLCDNHFEIQTDPSKFDYLILSGARRQIRLPEEEQEGVPDFKASGDREQLLKVRDAMSRLEKRVEDKMKAEQDKPSLLAIKNYRSRFEDSFAVNQIARAQYRERRKKLEQRKIKDRQLLRKASLNISLLKAKPEDREEARKLLSQSAKTKLSTLNQLKPDKFSVFDSSSFVESSSLVSSKSSAKTKIRKAKQVESK